MRVYVELPPEWGPGQAILAAWIHAGYRVDEVRSLGTGERRMVVYGGFRRPPASWPPRDGTSRSALIGPA